MRKESQNVLDAEQGYTLICYLKNQLHINYNYIHIQLWIMPCYKFNSSKTNKQQKQNLLTYHIYVGTG